MKNIAITTILWAALTLQSYAQSPSLGVSTIKMTLTTRQQIDAERTSEEMKESHNCYGDHVLHVLDPVFTKGADVGSSALLLNVYFFSPVSDENREWAISKPRSQIIPDDTTIPLVRLETDGCTKWRCPGCRRRPAIKTPAPE